MSPAWGTRTRGWGQHCSGVIPVARVASELLNKAWEKHPLGGARGSWRGCLGSETRSQPQPWPLGTWLPWGARVREDVCDTARHAP